MLMEDFKVKPNETRPKFAITGFELALNSTRALWLYCKLPSEASRTYFGSGEKNREKGGPL
jgi:hypothetical protein